MVYDIQKRINDDINLKKFLRENSNWYKELNRSRNSFSFFVREMKINYKLTTEDKINKTIDNISLFQGFLDILNK